MVGKIFITRSGYDPECGKHIKDPYLDPRGLPSIGACRPDIRRKLVPGDHLFVISGKVSGVQQFVVGGFEVAEKLDALAAYKRFPEQRLRTRNDGQLVGNIICDASRRQLAMDTHRTDTFEKRIDNYIVGRDPIALVSPEEIRRGRSETMDALREILRKEGERPIDLVGRWGTSLTERQTVELRQWLMSLKDGPTPPG